MLQVEGGGQTADKYQIFDATLTLGFSNERDGIQSVYSNPKMGSAMRLPRFAPEAGYMTNWVKSTLQHEGESLNEKREDQNYFFRVRTITDKYGKLISALYGKIHGEIDYSWPRGITFTYYLNSTPNDRNMEFAPARNLLTDLPSAAQVLDP